MRKPGIRPPSHTAAVSKDWIGQQQIPAMLSFSGLPVSAELQTPSSDVKLKGLLVISSSLSNATR